MDVRRTFLAKCPRDEIPASTDTAGCCASFVAEWVAAAATSTRVPLAAPPRPALDRSGAPARHRLRSFRVLRRTGLHAHQTETPHAIRSRLRRTRPRR